MKQFRWQRRWPGDRIELVDENQNYMAWVDTDGMAAFYFTPDQGLTRVIAYKDQYTGIQDLTDYFSEYGEVQSSALFREQQGS